jgi:hypothetical protein
MTTNELEQPHADREQTLGYEKRRDLNGQLVGVSL